MKTNNNIENLFSELQNHSVTPAKNIWSKIYVKYLLKTFFKLSIYQFNIYYLSATLLVGAGTIAIINPNIAKSKINQNNKIEQIQKIEPQTEEIENLQPEQKEIKQEQVKETPKPKIIKQENLTKKEEIKENYTIDTIKVKKKIIIKKIIEIKDTIK